jgi:hypothetical protein
MVSWVICGVLLCCRAVVLCVRSMLSTTRHSVKLVDGGWWIVNRSLHRISQLVRYFLILQEVEPILSKFVHSRFVDSNEIYLSTYVSIYLRVSIYLSIYLSIYGSTALVDLGLFFSFLIHTQSVGLLGRGISPSPGCYLHTEQHKHRINTNIHLCLEWYSNPRSQCLSGRRR